MARKIQMKTSSLNFEAGIQKVDRKKLYGYSEIEVKDEDGNKCSLTTLSDDGTEILPSGSTGITRFDSKGNYIELKQLQVVDLEGNDVQKFPSVFDEEVELQEVEQIEDYLDLNVKSIYQLEFDEDTKQEVIKYVSEKQLLYFQFNYRADYEPDDAFLITEGNEVFAVVGNRVEFEFLSFEVPVEEVSTDEEEEEDDFDFGML